MNELAARVPLDAVLQVAKDPGGEAIASRAPADIQILPPRSFYNAVKPLLIADPMVTETCEEIRVREI